MSSALSSDAHDHSDNSQSSSATSLFRSITSERASIKKRLFKDLATQLEKLVYLELITSYYLDNSFLRFLPRFIVHAWITGSSSSINIEVNPHSMFGHVIVVNLFAVVLPIFLSRSHLREISHGYLNGNFILDLVGQRSNASRQWILVLDVFIASAQLLYLSILQRERDNAQLLRNRNPEQTSDTETRTQDIESEERGILSDPILEPAQQPSARTNSTSLQDIYYRYETLGTIWIFDHKRLYQQYNRLRKPEARSNVLLLDRQ